MFDVYRGLGGMIHLTLLETRELDQDRKVSELLLPVLATMFPRNPSKAFQRQHPVQPKTFPALSSLSPSNTNWIVNEAGFILHRHYHTAKSFQLDLQDASLPILHCIDVKIWICGGNFNFKNHYIEKVNKR